jgi:hypothetical protein
MMTTSPILAGAGDWMELCQNVKDDPAQHFDQVDNRFLIRAYVVEGKRARERSQTSLLLTTIGNQLRYNHRRGKPLTTEIITQMNRYLQFWQWDDPDPNN